MPALRIIITVEADDPIQGVPETSTWIYRTAHSGQPNFWGSTVRKAIHNAATIATNAQAPVDLEDSLMYLIPCACEEAARR